MEILEIAASIITVISFAFGVWRWNAREQGQPSPDEVLATAVRESRPGLAFRTPFYWAFNDETPFCSRCYEKDGLPIHLRSVRNPVGFLFDCPNCGNEYRPVSHELFLPQDLRSKKSKQ
jgi:hypothetical protein